MLSSQPREREPSWSICYVQLLILIRFLVSFLPRRHHHHHHHHHRHPLRAGFWPFWARGRLDAGSWLLCGQHQQHYRYHYHHHPPFRPRPPPRPHLLQLADMENPTPSRGIHAVPCTAVFKKASQSGLTVDFRRFPRLCLRAMTNVFIAQPGRGTVRWTPAMWWYILADRCNSSLPAPLSVSTADYHPG